MWEKAGTQVPSKDHSSPTSSTVSGFGVDEARHRGVPRREGMKLSRKKLET